jgi:hypothetical protein
MCNEDCDFNPDPAFRKRAGLGEIPYEQMLQDWAEAPLSEWSLDEEEHPGSDWRARIPSTLAHTYKNQPDGRMRYWICHECYPVRLLVNKLKHDRMDD